MMRSLYMYELVIETNGENASYDPLQYQLFVLYRDRMYTGEDSTGYSTISNSCTGG